MADIYATPATQFDASITGAPTGLTTMGARIIDLPSGATVAPRVVATEVLAGSGTYAVTLTAPAAQGDYLVFWDDGSISPDHTASDTLHVTHDLPAGGSNGPYLITLEEYKGLLGVQAADTRKDAQVSALLPAATRAVRTYTGRNFEIAGGAATSRSFQYEGEWIVDIDDCESVVSVSTDAGVPGTTYDLTADQWTAMPQDDSDVFYYLLLHGGPYFGVSPEMGFERNLDQYEFSGRRPLLTVTAVWGWPVIPEDVKLATALTINSLLTSASGAGGRDESLTSEAIEGYSRSWGNKGAAAVGLVIPNRARDLLAGYQRIFV